MVKQALVECPKCFKLNALRNEHRHIIEGITELGTQCQHCQGWIHFGYFTPELIERKKQLTNRRRQRAFMRDFKMLQIEVERMLENETQPA